jgi:hypothetical protein
MGDRFYRAQNPKRSNAKVPQLFNKETFEMRLDSGISDALRALSNNFVTQVCRPAAFVAATVLYDEMRLRVPERNGLLKKSIYRWREKTGTTQRAIFYVGPNKRLAPHWHLLEYGHWVTRQAYFDEVEQRWITTKKFLAQPFFVPPKPYIRPTYDAKIQVALQAGYAEMKRRIKEKDLFVPKGDEE